MRVNVYTEELLETGGPNKPTLCEIVHVDYVTIRTGEKMRNYGVRIYLKSHPDLHYVPPRDDDRSAVTFWCGPKEKDCIAFLELLRDLAYASTLNTWREKTEKVQAEADAAIGHQPVFPNNPIAEICHCLATLNTFHANSDPAIRREISSVIHRIQELVPQLLRPL